MIAPEKNIAFLEKFRDRITRFLIAGRAPSRDPVWGGEGMFEMDKAMQDPAFRELRQDIDRMKGRAALILEELGIGCTFNQHPPPAAGGPIVRYPLFDLITDNRSQHSLEGAVFTAKIDDGIGRLQHEAAAKRADQIVAAMPVLPVQDLDASIAFYEVRLGFVCTRLDADHAVVTRGAGRLLLHVNSDTARCKAFLDSPDPEALAAEYQEKGVESVSATSMGGLRGFILSDPDGNTLIFGSVASNG